MHGPPIFPTGKHNGTVQGVKYFICKEKHGVFVCLDKLVRNPGNSSPSPSPRVSKRTGGVAPVPGNRGGVPVDDPRWKQGVILLEPRKCSVLSLCLCVCNLNYV